MRRTERTKGLEDKGKRFRKGGGWILLKLAVLRNFPKVLWVINVGLKVQRVFLPVLQISSLCPPLQSC